MRSRGDLRPFGLPPISEKKDKQSATAGSSSSSSSTDFSSSVSSSSSSSSPVVNNKKNRKVESNILKQIRIGNTLALPPPRIVPDDDSYMNFTASVWDFVAVYPSIEEDPDKRRFWIAQVGSDIPPGLGMEELVYIFYYEAENPSYTVFVKEGGSRKRVSIPYKSLLSKVDIISYEDEKGIVVITTKERDRLTERGKVLDGMKSSNNTSSHKKKKSK